MHSNVIWRASVQPRANGWVSAKGQVLTHAVQRTHAIGDSIDAKLRRCGQAGGNQPL
jgi:hypothetical protein